MLIVAGVLLVLLPPAWYFAPEFMLLQSLSVDKALEDTFYVVVHPHAGLVVTIFVLVTLGLISFVLGVRTVLKAP